MASGERDLTRGSVWRQVLAYAMPLVASSLLQALYSMVDTVIAGHFAGSAAISAINNSGQILNILTKIAIGITTGGNIIIGQYYGAKEQGRLGEASGTLLSLSLLLGAATAVGLYAGAYPLLGLLGAPAMEQSVAYLRICAVGMVFVFGYNALSAVLRGVGDSRTPLYFLIASSLANIVMDVVFVVCFHMGVGGVAWATFLCQGVASVLAAWTLFRRLRGVPAPERHPLFSWRMLGRIARIAVPSILQQSFISVGNLFIQSLVNSFGSAVVAGYSAAVKLNTFALTGFTTLGNGLSSFTAQNIGAGRPERVKQGFRAGAGMTLCVAVPFIAAFVFAGPQMVRLFLSAPSADALAQGTLFLNIVAPFYVLISLKLAADGVLRGAGDMGAFTAANLVNLTLRVVLAAVLAPRLGIRMVWYAVPVGWAANYLISFLRYRTGRWRERGAGLLA